MNIALILSSGIGERFGQNIPKQYYSLNGKKVIEYVIDTAKKSSKIDKVLIVASGHYCQSLKEEYNVETIEGGSTRNKSLKNGLNYIRNNYECNKLVILDAVRPFVTSDLINFYADKIGEYDVTVTAGKITDSLNCVDMPTCDRDKYFTTASPMAFDFDFLYKYLDENSCLVEVLQMLPEDTKTYYHFDFRENYKVTYPEDIELLEAIIHIKNRKSKNNL